MVGGGANITGNDRGAYTRSGHLLISERGSHVDGYRNGVRTHGKWHSS